MSKIRMNYDGWLALPAAVRRKLGLSTGDQLDLEVVAGTVVLRPLKPFAAAESPAAEELEAASTVTPLPSVKRGPGRPRKVAAAPSSIAGTVLPPHLKARGAKRKAAAAGETLR